MRSCQLKKNPLFRCGLPANAVCQYCGHAFCEGHGDRLPDGQEICARPRCQAKRRDLEAHEAYRAAVLAQNRLGRCGLGPCEELYTGQCSKCLGYFCEAHMEERPHHVVSHGHRTQRMGSLCEHCWSRRDLWERF